ncbi:hypothetical protein [Phaeodactylibacter xiamenensis]|uniref:hypothetical protein n=1 Tax=Phaeodactylibacter xiamenensis TaxID=1524460 RepID=UPI003CCB8ED7
MGHGQLLSWAVHMYSPQARITTLQTLQRLIQQMLDDKKNGGKTQKVSSQRQYRHYHCDDYEDEAR